MRASAVCDGIHWVGAIDWNLRDFHGYETPRGSTYNAYLVQGSAMTALVDTVKTPFVPELLARVSAVIDPAKVDLIVVNHVEPDHNSGLPDVMAAMPNARVVASASGVRGVAEYHDGLVVEPVGADDVIDLGGRTLRFLPAPMVHWPDSMFTYCPEARTLLCNDAYGQHLASAERFADEVGLDLAIEELGVYYANILLPVGAQIIKTFEKAAAAGWEPEIIAPSHGVIWRGRGLERAHAAYRRWTGNRLQDRVIIAYGTMWGSTDTLAASIADGIAAEGVEVSLFDVATTPIAHIVYTLLEARGLLIGSPTLHHGMLYRVAGLLQYLDGLKPAGRVGSAFGSLGWGGGATKQILGRLGDIGIEVVAEPYTQKFRPDPAELEAAFEWGRNFALTLKG